MNKGGLALSISFFAALNISIGFIVQALKLPIYLDSIGTILSAVLLGPIYGVITGFVGLLVLSFITVPTALAYSITAAIIAVSASFFVRFSYLQKWPSTIVFGLIIGVIAAIVSAPITTYLFGGISFAGADAFTTFFKATGKTLATSVLLGGLATDPVDKLLTSICCHILLFGLPNRVRDFFPNSKVL